MAGLESLVIPPELLSIIGAAVLIVIRISTLIFLMPSIGDTIVKTRIRVALVIGLSLAMFPLLIPEHMSALENQDFLALAIFESVIGFALGFGFRVLVFALMIAGAIIAQAISLSQLFGAETGVDPNPTVAVLLMSAGTVLFVTLDLHTKAFGLFYQSYEVFPLGAVPDFGGLSEWAMERVAASFGLGVSLALPFVLINFVYNAVLGLINQAMPQMMVTFIGVPANVLAGIFVLVVAAGAILVAWIGHYDTALRGFW